MLPRGHFFPAPAGQDELTALDPALAAHAWLSLLKLLWVSSVFKNNLQIF